MHQEHRRRDYLVATHDYLSVDALCGKSLRHVGTLEETWIGLLGWRVVALKLTGSDCWGGRSAQRNLRHLHLVVWNSCFVILE